MFKNKSFILNKHRTINKADSNKNSRRLIGFTLLELLVVIGIIGVLATLAMVAVKYAKEQARIAQVKSDTDQIYTAISMLANDTNEWPGHQPVNSICSGGGCANNEICGDGCNYGLASSSSGILANDGSFSGWSGPYMRSMPLDPWDHEYFFDTDYRINIDGDPCNDGGGCSDAVVLGSYGPDGMGNNQYNGDDIIKIIVK